jgi:hypothetical protein
LSLRRSVFGAIAPLLATVAVTLGAGTVVGLVAPVAAYADSTTSMESQFIAKMNAAREANGLHPYAVAGDLTSIARQHSADMARQQQLYHNPNLTTQVQNWQAVGENVGEGPTVDDIHNAFMQSPEHRANILDHDFTQVGVGVSVDKNGVIWVTEDFREPMHSTSTTAHTPRASTPASSSSTQTWQATPSTRAALTPHRTPRAALMHRLRDLRHTKWLVSARDPIAQAVTYFQALSQLAR